ncbi:MAG: sugar phosphate isomerase/epimerase [Clostridia bacterium]|nr:sugar phosphate isomerase/epimerase [Clostridia bacterium]
MKVGVCVNFDSLEEIEGKIKMMVREGFDNCQIISWDPAVWTDENAVKLKEMLAENKITVSAFWSGWEGPRVWNFYDGPKTLGLVPREYREVRVKNLCDGGDFAKKLGVTDVITHMGFIPENPNDPEFEPFCDAVRVVAQHLRANGQHLLFETGQETPATMLRCFEVVGTDNLGVNFDMANLISYGKANPVDALDTIGTYVRNVHAKDGRYPRNGHKLGGEMPMGQGKVDFRGVLSGLYALGYNGYVTIEREIEGEQQILDIRESKKFLQKIIDEVCV